MRLSVFIVCILIAFSSSAQSSSDSIARFRKPVAEFLIGEHHRAERLQERVKETMAQQMELRTQLTLKEQIIQSHKQDSIHADSLLRLEQATSGSWKSSFELEKEDHSQTKKQVKKWKLIVVVVVALEIVSFIAGN